MWEACGYNIFGYTSTNFIKKSSSDLRGKPMKHIFQTRAEIFSPVYRSDLRLEQGKAPTQSPKVRSSGDLRRQSLKQQAAAMPWFGSLRSDQCPKLSSSLSCFLAQALSWCPCVPSSTIFSSRCTKLRGPWSSYDRTYPRVSSSLTMCEAPATSIKDRSMRSCMAQKLHSSLSKRRLLTNFLPRFSVLHQDPVFTASTHDLSRKRLTTHLSRHMPFLITQYLY